MDTAVIDKLANRILRYCSEDEAAWNAFVAKSKQGVFLFDRGFMNYHDDRFVDHSLLCYRGDELLAVFPANERRDNNAMLVQSHGGLTFGGLLTDASLKTSEVLALMQAIREYYANAGFAQLLYKVVPHIYHHLPAEEDRYALFRLGAAHVASNVSSTIEQANWLGLSKGKKANKNRSIREGVMLSESGNMAAFMELASEQMQEKYDARPVHSADELCLLQSRFPDRIKLHVAMHDGSLVAGVVMFLYDNVAHVQYIASNALARRIGALDYLLGELIQTTYASYRYFDFGISTEENGYYLNEGLLQQKEYFGGRAITYDHYRLDLHSLTSTTP